MNELIYNINNYAIALLLFVSMAVAIESGYRLGLKSTTACEAFKAHTNTISSSLLGILALLLGFTFSLSLQRYDSRSQAVVDEANAIGTAYLRAYLLPIAVRETTLDQLRDYVDLRVKTSDFNLTERDERERLNAEAGHQQLQLWNLVRRAVAEDPNIVTTGLYVQALNEVIDNFGKRDAELNRHVPEPVLLLLFITFVMTGGVVGYATGLSGHRASFVTHLMVTLIVVLVFIILDLDRPRRGLIQVSQKSFIDLQTAVHSHEEFPTVP